jgi:RNA polymerase sigma-70 factor (ECF subfamily)
MTANCRTADPEVVLMLRVQRGDPGAFALLVERYWRRVCGRLYRQLGDRGEAEDLTQDVFLRVYRARARYRPRARFTTWLFFIARNVARNALRSRRRRPVVTGGGDGPDAVPFLEEMLADTGEGPERPLQRAELASRVRSAVAGLERRQRTAVELFQFDGRSHKQVAEEMATTTKAVKALLARARGRLRERLGAVREATAGAGVL